MIRPARGGIVRPERAEAGGGGGDLWKPVDFSALTEVNAGDAGFSVSAGASPGLISFSMSSAAAVVSNLRDSDAALYSMDMDALLDDGITWDDDNHIALIRQRLVTVTSTLPESASFYTLGLMAGISDGAVAASIVGSVAGIGDTHFVGYGLSTLVYTEAGNATNAGPARNPAADDYVLTSASSPGGIPQAAALPNFKNHGGFPESKQSGSVMGVDRKFLLALCRRAGTPAGTDTFAGTYYVEAMRLVLTP